MPGNTVKTGGKSQFLRGLRRCAYICYMIVFLLCLADGAEIADQPDVVLYAAVDKSALKKNENKVDLVTEDVPKKKGLYFPISHPLSLSIYLPPYKCKTVINYLALLCN